MSALIQEHQPADAGNNIATASMWVALAEESEDLARLRSSGKWEALPSEHRVLWTDDYSDVLSVLR